MPSSFTVCIIFKKKKIYFKEMAFSNFAYRYITKRFSTLFVAVTIGACAVDLIVDKGGDLIFDYVRFYTYNHRI